MPWDDRPRRDRRYPYRDDERRWDERGPKKPRSAAVTTLAIISLIAGPVELVVGLCVLTAMALAPGEKLEAPGLPGIGGSSLISWVMIATIFFWGILNLAAGVGLLFRGNWARILCLVLGAFAVLVGLLYLMVVILLVAGFQGTGTDDKTTYCILDAIASGCFLGYGVFAYVVLLHPARVAEFR